jgi:exosortase A-associated hydrolase 2
LPLFLGSPDHPLFACAALPASLQPDHGLLVCPPFAEEMNRSRRTVRLLAVEAARRGLAVVNTDLYGTGDSGGEFGDARWAGWIGDLRTAASFLRERGCARVTLLGIRSGALLACALLRSPPLPVASLVLWQPVTAGKAVVTDLLRARIAAGAAQGTGETVAGRRARLAGGETLEAGGYALAPEMATALEAASLDAAEAPPRTCWIEVGAGRAASAATIERLRASGASVDALTCQDPPFWSTTETTVGQATVAATVAWLERSA